MTSHLLLEPVRRFAKAELRKLKCSQILAAILETMEQYRGHYFTDEDLRRHASFVTGALKHPVGTWREGKGSVKEPLEALTGESLGRGLLQWAEAMIYAKLHPLTSTYALDTANLLMHLAAGTYYFGPDGRTLVVTGVFTDDDAQLNMQRWISTLNERPNKKSVTERIGGEVIRFLVPNNGLIQTLSGETAAGSGKQTRAAVNRCHLSQKWGYETSSFKAKWDRGLAFDLAAVCDMKFDITFSQRSSQRFPWTMYIPVDWATGVLHGDGIDGEDYEFEPVPDWADPSQVFDYRRQLQILRPRPVPNVFRPLDPDLID